MPAQEIETGQGDAQDPVPEEDDHHGAALLDGYQFVRPGEQRHPDAQSRAAACVEQAEGQGEQHAEEPCGGGGLQHDRPADRGEEQGNAGEEQLHGAFGPEYGFRLHGQGLGDPQAFPLQRDGGGCHVAHGSDHAQGCAEQYCGGVWHGGEYVVQGGEYLPSLDEQQNAAYGNDQDAETAVEHIVGAGGEPGQLLAQQRPEGRFRFYRLFRITLFCGGAPGGRQLQEAAGDPDPDQEKEDRRHDGKENRAEPVPFADPAEEIKDVGRPFDPGAVDCRVRQHIPDQEIRLEVNEVVDGDEYQGGQNGDKALILQLDADLCHHPAQQTGENEDEEGHDEEQKDPADHLGRCRPGHRPADDQGGEQDHGRVQGPHEIYVHQPGGDDGTHGNGQGEELVVVLGQIQPGISVEHTAEGAEDDGDPAHQQVIEPPHARLGQPAAETEGEGGEHAAQDADHDDAEEEEPGDHRSLGAHPVFLRIVEVALEYLRQLLFQQDLQHLTLPPVPGRPLPGCRPP